MFRKIQPLVSEALADGVRPSSMAGMPILFFGLDGCGLKSRRSGLMNGLFPLTPALSLGERENRWHKWSVLPVSNGRLKRAVSQPPLRGSVRLGAGIPNVETLGYCQISLWEKDFGTRQCGRAYRGEPKRRSTARSKRFARFGCVTQYAIRNTQYASRFPHHFSRIFYPLFSFNRFATFIKFELRNCFGSLRGARGINNPLFLLRLLV